MLTSDAKPDPPIKNVENDCNLLTTNFSYERLSKISNVECTLRNKKTLPHSDKKHFVILNESLNNSNSKEKVDNALIFNIVNSNGIRIGTTTKNVFNIIQLTENSKNPGYTKEGFESLRGKKMPLFVQKLKISKKELTIYDMFVIKTHTGYGWRKVFLSLGYSNGQLDQFIENYKSKGISEVIYQILLDWKCANGKSAHIGKIVEKLWEHEEYDCVKKLRDIKLN